jgi:Arc/MetJ-type ribon-helix-helix transcriptional regulator
MATRTINISMPASLGEFVDRRLKEDGFGNVSEYFRYLVREERRALEERSLEAKLLEGMASGPPEEATDAWWTARRKKRGAAKRLRRG